MFINVQFNKVLQIVLILKVHIEPHSRRLVKSKWTGFIQIENSI